METNDLLTNPFLLADLLQTDQGRQAAAIAFAQAGLDPQDMLAAARAALGQGNPQAPQLPAQPTQPGQPQQAQGAQGAPTPLANPQPSRSLG